jgi:phytol kinase
VPSLAGVRAQRSIEGSAAVLVTGAVAAMIGFRTAGISLPSAIIVGLACGAAGALVEAVSTHGLDNFTTQVAAAATAALLL